MNTTGRLPKVPHLMRFCRASVGVSVAPGSWQVWALGADGVRKRRLPYAYTPKGRLVFTADVAVDPKSATWLYELQAASAAGRLRH